jgi:transcriptional regulator with XRE-family HTH domain
MDMIELRKTVKQRRALLKIDQKSLAEISGVAVHTISDIESGKGNPTVKVLSEILNALGMEISISVKEVNNNES